MSFWRNNLHYNSTHGWSWTLKMSVCNHQMAHICNYSVKNWSEWVWLNPLQLYWTNSFVCITAGYDTGCGDHGYSLHYLVNVSEWIRSRKRRQEDVWLTISTQWRRMAQCLKMLWMMVTVNSNLSSAFSCALKLLITGLNNAQTNARNI